MKQAILLFLLSVQIASGAIVERWFAVSSAGAADGTSHANRAALFSAGNWSTVISGFNFAGSDSLKCYIEAGSYTCSQTLGAAIFSNVPTTGNPLILVGADSSGNALTPPDPNWTSAQPAWSTATLPTIATTTNIPTINLTGEVCFFYLINFTATSRTTTGGVVSSATSLVWCQVTNSASGTAVNAVGAVANSINSVYSCTAASYDAVVNITTGTTEYTNCRIVGNASASSGNRRGMTFVVADPTVQRCTVINNVGEGVLGNTAAAGSHVKILESVIANNGTGLKTHSTASQSTFFITANCMITGNTTGIDGNSNAGRVLLSDNRLRNGTNTTGMGNLPTNLGNNTSAGSDAADYANATNGDFRIRMTSSLWGKGFGVQDQPRPNGFFIQ
jgi:hypothetical protein